MPSTEGQSAGEHQCSSKHIAQRLWVQEEEYRERRHECRKGTQMFLTWMVKADVLLVEVTPRGEAYCRQLGQFYESH